MRLAGLALPPAVAWIVFSGFVFVVAAAWQMRRRPVSELGRELDRRYELDDLMITAVEVDQRGPRSNVEGRLLDDAATAVATLGDERAIDDRASRREGETAAALLLVVVGLWLLVGTVGRPMPVEALPPLSDHGGEGTSDGSGAGASGSGGSGDPSEGLGALAGALGDHAAAREIALALAGGDAAQAAREARSLAERAGDLSSAGRRDLADVLSQAADEVEPTDPDLARALRQAAQAIESPDPDSAASGVDRLARELDALAALQVGPMGVAEAENHDRLGPRTRRLSVDPELAALQATPMPGSSAGWAAGGQDSIGVESEGVEVRGGAPLAETTAVGADPLRYPWSLREAVQQYFRPQERTP